MTSVAMLVGGALANALVFNGDCFFTILMMNGVDEERKHHYQAV